MNNNQYQKFIFKTAMTKFPFAKSNLRENLLRESAIELTFGPRVWGSQVTQN